MLESKTYRSKSTPDEFNEAEHVKSVGNIFLSEPFVSINYNNEITSHRKVKSETKVESNINYDDLCGPWFYLANPTHARYDNLFVPKLCTWESISFKDITFMKEHQQDKNAILLFLKCKFSKCISADRNDIFPKIAWEIFELARSNSFAVKGISASIGLFYLTHRYFLSNTWCTMEDTYNFFCNTLLVHTVLSPPKSDEIFNLDECKLLLEIFHTIYMENLILLRLVCSSNYSLTMSFGNIVPISQEEPSSL
ncbi:hypothetical protein KPH14_010810 [Odynerus spinipes]|uniref:Uncharacterized protein n=1 Tax=Odynerus spinipes TaxID=1348599 RepID=A0AAD9VM45_9HYME|nr:hypothetical protein KPH14_010810 [Odynerus spinipes]